MPPATDDEDDPARAHVHGFHTYPARMHPVTAARLVAAVAGEAGRGLAAENDVGVAEAGIGGEAAFALPIREFERAADHAGAGITLPVERHVRLRREPVEHQLDVARLLVRRIDGDRARIAGEFQDLGAARQAL